MNTLICETYEKMSEAAAAIIAAQIMTKPHSVLGLATGSTPLGTYAELARLYREGTLNFENVKSFNLDEYLGVGSSNDQSYSYFMMENLFNKINIDKANVKLLDGLTESPENECKLFEELIKLAGGIDIQLLGIGINGHIGFNEPDSQFSMATHLVRLAETTLNANSRFFKSVEEVPQFALTMGIGTIMKARKILVLASGEEKADIIRELVFGDIKPQTPASVLRFHSSVTIITDRAAGAKIANRI